MKNVAFDLSLLLQQRLAVELPEREAAVELEEEEHIPAEEVEEHIVVVVVVAVVGRIAVAVAVELAAVFELSFDYSPLRSKQREWDRSWHADLTVDGSSSIFCLFGTSWQDKITVFTKNTKKIQKNPENGAEVLFLLAPGNRRTRFSARRQLVDDLQYPLNSPGPF